jgi:chromosome segregation ATPase
MTRIIGQLVGADGPLNGRLFVKAGGAFIGAPSKELVFKVSDGLVDIELPPCPSSIPYWVDWRDTGDARRLSYPERWYITPSEEISLEEARGLVARGGTAKVRRERSGSLLEETLLRNEVEELRRQLAEAEQEKTFLLRQVGDAQSACAAAQARTASLSAELTKAQQQAVVKQEPVGVVEKVIERLKTTEEQAQETSSYIEKIQALEAENASLKADWDNAVALGTHFANLNAQIDRLTNEKQELQLLVEDLKRPVRSASSLRNEAIANLDRLIAG